RHRDARAFARSAIGTGESPLKTGARGERRVVKPEGPKIYPSPLTLVPRPLPCQHALGVRHIDQIGNLANELVFVYVQFGVRKGYPPKIFDQDAALLECEQAFYRRGR